MKSSSPFSQSANITAQSIDDFVDTDDFLKDLDVAFDEIQLSAPSKSRKKKISETSEMVSDFDFLSPEFAPVQDTFKEMMQLHLKPLVRYMKAIGSGVNSKDLMEVVLLVTKPLIVKTKKLSLTVQADSLEQLVEILQEAISLHVRKLPNEMVRKLMESVDLVCEAFDLSYRGHSSAVVNVVSFFQSLRKNKSVKEEDIKKLFAIGIPSITMLRQSSVIELSSLTGLSPEKVTLMRSLARNFSVIGSR